MHFRDKTIVKKSSASQGIVFYDGQWHDENPMVLGPASHAAWMASTVFDGARAFAGCAPDLDRHCARAVKSANALGLVPDISASEIEALAREGIKRFSSDTALYVCPMFYAEKGFIAPDPETTRFALIVLESPLPEMEGGFSACLSRFKRPAADMAPNDAKAACLYPNVARALGEAKQGGFDTAVVLDPEGAVAEFAYANLFMVSDGTIHTPKINGTFLDGITRQRVIALLSEAGHDVVERSIRFEELTTADELFGTGNYYKIAPCTRLDNREFAAGPVYAKTRELYFNFAQTCPVN
jgi:branched-chain amino acid aminotransferase